MHAMQQSIDISCWPGHSSKVCPLPTLLIQDQNATIIRKICQTQKLQMKVMSYHKLISVKAPALNGTNLIGEPSHIKKPEKRHHTDFVHNPPIITAVTQNYSDENQGACSKLGPH